MRLAKLCVECAHAQHTQTDPRPARSRRRRRRRVPVGPAARHPGLPACRHRRGSARIRMGARRHGYARTRRVRHRIHDVLDRPRIQPSAPALDASRGVRARDWRRSTITTAAAMAVLYFVGYGWKAGLVLGGALAMSSTAIVSKMLAERMELCHAARPRQHGDTAVPGPGRGRVPDRHPVAGQAWRARWRWNSALPSSRPSPR